MLPNNFADTRQRFPELTKASQELEDWVQTNPQLSHIEVRRLLKQNPQADPAEVSLLLGLLVQEGKLRREFGIIAPTNHVLAPEFFDTIEGIPERFHDSNDDPFNTDDGEIVEIFRGLA
jgi:hypothetical protein